MSDVITDFPLDDLDPDTRGPVLHRGAGDRSRLIALTPTFYLDVGSVITAEYKSNGVLAIQYRLGGDAGSMLLFGDGATEAWARLQYDCRRYQ